MENKKPKIDYSKLSSEQRDKLESYQINTKKLQKLEDIADMTQEIIYMFEELKDAGDKTGNSYGALLVDIRESIQKLVEKEDVKYDDEKVVEALKKLDHNIMEALKRLEAPQQVSVNAPDVVVQAPEVDLSGVKEVVKDGYKSFVQAIKDIPEVKIPEYPDRWDEVLLWLQSIDTASRLKPEFPTQIKVVNPDGSTIGDEIDYAVRLDDSNDPVLYIGKAQAGSDEADPVWQIAKLDTGSGLSKTWAGTGFDQVWDDRTSLTYL